MQESFKHSKETFLAYDKRPTRFKSRFTPSPFSLPNPSWQNRADDIQKKKHSYNGRSWRWVTCEIPQKVLKVVGNPCSSFVVTSELVMNTLSEKKKIRQTDLNQVAWFWDALYFFYCDSPMQHVTNNLTKTDMIIYNYLI